MTTNTGAEGEERVRQRKPTSSRSGSRGLSPSASAEKRVSNGAVPREGTAGDENVLDVDERAKVYAVVEQYAKADDFRAWMEFLPTVGLFVFLYATFYNEPSLWKRIAGMVIVSLFRVRLFVIFHDMAHDAFFSSHTMNMVVGTVAGVFTHTPLSFWQRGHNHHHRHSNNIKYPQLSQSSPWTLAQYNRVAPWKQTLYRLTYTKFGFLAVLPFTVFGVLHRFVSKWYEHVLDFAYLAVVWHLDCWTFEFWSFVMAGPAAFSLFHAQHTFPGARRYRPDKWSFYENAMSGSSFLQIPTWFKYFTANIEYHHIHHLNPLVPLYRLPSCHKAAGKLFDRVPRTTLSECFQTMTPLAWDEENNKWVELRP